MLEGPNLVRVAALIGDHARCAMLNALMRGAALTATELAAEANVSKQTASAHLAKLVDAGLLTLRAQGRHRYYRLAADDVAKLLEQLMIVADRTGPRVARPGPRDPALRKARVCYDHLAGELGVALYDALLARRLLRVSVRDDDGRTALALTAAGQTFCERLGVDPSAYGSARRPVCRPCLDWSARRYHLAGSLGAALLQYCYRRRWAKRSDGSRVVRFSARGEQRFRDALLQT